MTRQPPSSPPSQPQARDSNPVLQAPSTPVRNLPPVPPFPNSSATSTSHIPDSLPASQDIDIPSDALNEFPAVILQLLHGVTHTLRTAFSDKPPHTVQRLAELILHPTNHHKTLPAYLRALDRIVSVSSSADIFPLSDAPAIVNGVNGDGGGGILWSNNDPRNGYDRDSLGSDESLGGALLTPIPWLRNGLGSVENSSEDSVHLDSNSSTSTDALGEVISLAGAQGSLDPLVPEREDGAVTQGELMRMEQEAGVVPLTQNPEDTNVTRTMADGDEEAAYMDEADVMPHARGPDVVGSVDMGRVDGKDVELHIGSPPGQGDHKDANPNNAQTVLASQPESQATSTVTAPDASGTAPSAADSEEFEIVNKDAVEAEVGDAMQLDDTQKPSQTPNEQDGDIVLVDADGKTEEDKTAGNKADASGESVGPDAADASTVT